MPDFPDWSCGGWYLSCTFLTITWTGLQSLVIVTLPGQTHSLVILPPSRDIPLGNHVASYHGNIFTAIWNFVSYIVDKMPKEYHFNLDYYVLIYVNEQFTLFRTLILHYN